jgi:protein-L-isoaspartate(D-aspartate) O-methyltransferase
MMHRIFGRHFRHSQRFVVPLSCLTVACLLVSGEQPYAVERERMVDEQIEGRGIRNPDILRALRDTPRHLFVPADVQPYAYSDQPLPIGFGQTISQPYIVALMTELLEPRKRDQVLEIGTGSGYQAAVLARLSRRVYSIEIVPELAKLAGERLAGMRIRNITVRQGDGYKGWPDQAPFDRIILTAAPPEIPQALLDQLSRGGRLVAPVGESPFAQVLVVVEKTASGEIRRRSVAPVAFVPMVTEPHRN